MKINQIYKFKKTKNIKKELRGKLVKIVENKPNPTWKDIPSFEHGFVHIEVDGKYVDNFGLKIT